MLTIEEQGIVGAVPVFGSGLNEFEFVDNRKK